MGLLTADLRSVSKIEPSVSSFLKPILDVKIGK
jgi:hypothetical protein